MSALHWLGAAEAARRIAARDLSPVDLVQALLERIERVDPAIHCVATLDRDGALAAARVAEQEAGAGRLRGPLHGVPVGVKDIIDVAGLATTCQSRILEGNVARADAACVERLRGAGAIVLGKLITHEFAMGGPSFDLPWPPARNPWHVDHHPGGSSAGSGAAVAAGLVPLAIGTDTAGSVRHPASACGIVGLKPTYGLVSRHGVFPMSPTLDHVGPMARSVTDAALMLQAMAGPDARDPASAAPPAWPSPLAGIEAGVRGLRIGYVRHFHETDLPADPEVGAALDQVARTLEAEGAEVRDVRLPALREFAAPTWALVFAHGWAVHARWLRERPGDYGQLARRRLMTGAFLSAGDLARAECLRARMVAAVSDVLGTCDVLLCASLMDPPCRIDDAAQLERTLPRQARTPFSLTGHPALAMPAGCSRGGLPLSVQFVGRWFDEATVLRVARAWERAGNTQAMRPPLDAALGLPG